MNTIGAVCFRYANLALLSSFLVASDIWYSGNVCGILPQGDGSTEATVVTGATVLTSTGASRFILDATKGSLIPSRQYLMMLLMATLYSLLRIIGLLNRVVNLAAVLSAKVLRLASLWTAT